MSSTRYTGYTLHIAKEVILRVELSFKVLYPTHTHIELQPFQNNVLVIIFK